MSKADLLRNEILARVKEFYKEEFALKPFIPGQTPIPVSGKVFDQRELECLVDASLDFWLTTGRYAQSFERTFSRLFDDRGVVLCNSGSSANLLAIAALSSESLGEQRLFPGDEVITCGVGFPTTVNPIVQYQAQPVFVDAQLGTYNVDPQDIAVAISPKTKAIILAHTLGNPFEIDKILSLIKGKNIWLIEDNCDALGSTYQGQLTGTLGDLATLSFYPAHQITMGEGGSVLTKTARLKKIVESFRDWGRDCWCDPGKDNTCGKRFDWQLGHLPAGYDHKYIYSHLGYNLKLTDMQAAVGVAQLEKLNDFIAARQRNWEYLYHGLKRFKDFLILPRATTQSDPSWFGFALTIREDAPFTRAELVAFLQEHKIATRLLFGGCLPHQPAYRRVHYRICGELKNAEIIMRQSFWIGVYPGLTTDMLSFVLEIFARFVAMKT